MGKPAFSGGEPSHAIWLRDHGEVSNRGDCTALAFNLPVEIGMVALTANKSWESEKFLLDPVTRLSPGERLCSPTFHGSPNSKAQPKLPIRVVHRSVPRIPMFDLHSMNLRQVVGRSVERDFAVDGHGCPVASLVVQGAINQTQETVVLIVEALDWVEGLDSLLIPLLCRF